MFTFLISDANLYNGTANYTVDLTWEDDGQNYSCVVILADYEGYSTEFIEVLRKCSGKGFFICCITLHQLFFFQIGDG